MRRIFLPFVLILLFFPAALLSCNNGEKEKPKDQPGAKAEEQQMSPEAEKGLALVANSDCFQCHDVSQKRIGPTYEAVAEKYREENDALIDTLAQRIIKGSQGHWGVTPMTPHPDLSPEDARLMVKYVLSIK